MGIADRYIDNVTGTTINRPELITPGWDAEPGDAILNSLDYESPEPLRKKISSKQSAIVSLDWLTIHPGLSCMVIDDFSRNILKAVNGMMLNIFAAIARKTSKIGGVIRGKSEAQAR